MNAERYAIVARYCGRFLADFLPHPFPAEATSELRWARAIYIAADAMGTVRYVGSVAQRGPEGLMVRLAGHLRSAAKRVTWKWLWVLPLVDETPREVVRSLEGLVGLHLHPVDSRRLPSVLNRDRVRPQPCSRQLVPDSAPQHARRSV